TERRFAQRDFAQAALYGLPAKAQAPLPPEVTIERATAATVDEFTRVTAESFEWPREWRDAAMGGVRTSFSEPGWHRFFALCEGQPAGVASMFVRDGVAGLVDDAIVP